MPGSLRAPDRHKKLLCLACNRSCSRREYLQRHLMRCAALVVGHCLVDGCDSAFENRDQFVEHTVGHYVQIPSDANNFAFCTIRYQDACMKQGIVLVPMYPSD